MTRDEAQPSPAQLAQQRLLARMEQECSMAWEAGRDGRWARLAAGYSARYLAQADRSQAELRTLIRDPRQSTEAMTEAQFRHEFDMAQMPVRWLVDSQVGPGIGMVIVVGGQRAEAIGFSRSYLVIASPLTWRQWGLSPDRVTQGAWPQEPVWQKALGPKLVQGAEHEPE